MTVAKSIAENEKTGPPPGDFPPRYHDGSASILVVDDQPANITVVGSVLGGLGHEIIPAADGATALKRIAVRKPDLILLDVLMPVMDGYEVCRRLKENPEWKDIPIIFLSAADDKDLIVRALNSGGVDFITKPFNQAELISRVRTQLALKNALDRLKQLAEDKDELIGILAHDLKNHVGGMNMSAELLRAQIGKLKDERLTRLSENILRSSGQLLAFVKEFLANAAADYGFVPKPGRVNFGELVLNVVRQYSETAKGKNLELHVDTAPEAMVFADASALTQIVDNLISNALKFSPPGKKIYVNVRAQNHHIECIVRDEGPGFTEEDKKRMFRRYGRLSARPTGGEPSTGLGLSIVRKLVLAIDGELNCESEPEKGATFTIKLPKSTF
ncbi:MAG TPA: hybrid sensor histidine kinase/response regulator [Verrucomicrobiae bacterium]|nr:hybrid sensor histidine kinase/response regulator [Verrucomicrobiae bacterium]